MKRPVYGLFPCDRLELPGTGTSFRRVPVPSAVCFEFFQLSRGAAHPMPGSAQAAWLSDPSLTTHAQHPFSSSMVVWLLSNQNRITLLPAVQDLVAQSKVMPVADS